MLFDRGLLRREMAFPFALLGLKLAALNVSALIHHFQPWFVMSIAPHPASPALRSLFAAMLLTAASTPAAESSATHKVTRGTLKSTLQLDAVIEAREMTPVKLSPKIWTDLTVVDAVPHGSRVEKGDPLVRLDLDKLREQIADLERDQPGARLALEVAEAELRQLMQSTPLRLEAARRSQRIATEEYDYFVSYSRGQRERSAAFNVRSAEERLASSQEELKQLEKMYKADELTEDTEEIIIKRQRFAVEAAEFSLANTRAFAERELKTTIPRDHEGLKAKKLDEDLALALAEITLPRALEKKRTDTEKLARDTEKAAKRLADLKADLAHLEARAPAAGIAYYGACDLGRWTTGALVSKKLVPTGKLLPNEVIVTIVDPAKLQLRATAGEADLMRLRAGMKAEAAPAAAPHLKLAAALEQIGSIPLPTGGFEAILSFKPDKSLKLVPGLNAKVTFSEVPKPEALLVPKAAVVTEGTQKYVLLKSRAGEDKRPVKTGDSDDKMIEITDGLKEGDVVVMKRAE
jgi:HlyD family secretion protein